MWEIKVNFTLLKALNRKYICITIIAPPPPTDNIAVKLFICCRVYRAL